MSSFLSFLYILKISPLSEVGLVKIFSQSVGYHFVWLAMSFALQKFLGFRSSHLFIVALNVCAVWILFRKWSPMPKHSSVLPTFSSVRFSVGWFYIAVFDPFGLEFCAWQ